VSRRGSILAGGRRPDVEEKWTHNSKRNVCPKVRHKSGAGFIVLMQIMETFDVNICSAYWSVCCKRATDLARFQFLMYPGPILQ